MIYYLKCFDKVICLKLCCTVSDLLQFWLKRFCPNIIICEEVDNKCNTTYDYMIEFIESKKNSYKYETNWLKLYGKLIDNVSYVAKLVTQCFQKLLIEDNILIIPSSCVSKGQNGILIIGDFWQGKTSVAINMTKKYGVDLLADNYVAIKDGFIIGTTSYISIRKEDVDQNLQEIYSVNDRYFYENHSIDIKKVKIVGFLLPYINDGDNNIHIISKEESTWYLYQKFSRLLCGETILFDGMLPSPVFLNKHNSQKILNIVRTLLMNNNIKYTSTSMEKIVEEGFELLSTKEVAI